MMNLVPRNLAEEHKHTRYTVPYIHFPLNHFTLAVLFNCIVKIIICFFK